ncbi:unnamed protein product [Pleuronectes platessa]|uniref:Uncharacterized protein n=1 Tax=Pleuronectes platessa TaxID=8262 RepID=A0A9N7U761_PLEPL|nr:unnamed protein product [Pleuronectes platessa]
MGGPFGVQHLAQGHFGMQMGQTGDQTADLQFESCCSAAQQTSNPQSHLRCHQVLQDSGNKEEVAGKGLSSLFVLCDVPDFKEVNEFRFDWRLQMSKPAPSPVFNLLTRPPIIRNLPSMLLTSIQQMEGGAWEEGREEEGEFGKECEEFISCSESWTEA